MREIEIRLHEICCEPSWAMKSELMIKNLDPSGITPSRNFPVKNPPAKGLPVVAP